MLKKCVYSLILTLTLATQLVVAQRFSPDYWHDGGAVFKEGDTLKGKVYYSLGDNTVQLDDGVNKHFYNAFKLQQIYFKSSVDSSFRVFYVHEYTQENNYTISQFFEKLYEDTLGESLLGRERLVFFSSSSGIGFADNKVSMGYDLYRMNVQGKITYLSYKKKEFVKSFSGKEKRIANFIKENKCNLHKADDVKAIIQYYNSIKKS